MKMPFENWQQPSGRISFKNFDDHETNTKTFKIQSIRMNKKV